MATYESRITGGEYMVPNGGGYLRLWDDNRKEYIQVTRREGGAISACENTLESVVTEHERMYHSKLCVADLEVLLDEGLIDSHESWSEAARIKMKNLGY